MTNTLNAITKRMNTITNEELEAIYDKMSRVTDEDLDLLDDLDWTICDRSDREAIKEAAKARKEADKLLKKYGLTYIDYSVWENM